MGEEIDWSLTTFEGARRAQRLESAKLTFRERLMWVEQMYELAERLQRKQKPPEPGSGGGSISKDPDRGSTG